MMELPSYLRTTLLRQRWLAAAERFELALAAREPDYPAQKKQALEQRLALREAALATAYIALDQLDLRFDPNQPRIPAGKPMSRATAKANAKKSTVRCHVEHVFAELKSRMGLVVRTIGLARAEATITLANMAFNMKRWVLLNARTLPA